MRSKNIRFSTIKPKDLGLLPTKNPLQGIGEDFC
jgi:hypothetical protein